MKLIRMLAVGASVWLAWITTLAATQSRPDLVGRVTDVDDSPVTNATVFIYTAGPRAGTSSLCPSCYADCSKKARTDTAGRFKVESLDPKLLFRLLVVGAGHESLFVPKVDPAAGEVKIELNPLSQEALKSKRRILGMVMSEDGKPVIGAIISPEGVDRGTGTQWGGIDKFVDPLAVADEHGHFVLLCQDGADAVHATVEGGGAAKRWLELKPGRDYLIRVQDGVTVTGHVVANGQPIKDALVGLVTSDRACGNCLRYDEVATDKDGRFILSNVTPEREFVLYAKMESLGSRGTLPTKTFTTGKSGATSDLGTLAVQPAHRLAGRVVLSDGKPVPADTRLFLGREGAWDHTEAVLDADGGFEFNGVPAESISLSIRIKGYKLSKRNPSLDWLNGMIIGRLTGDLTDLVLSMEPGEWRFNGEEGDPPVEGDRQPRDQPLRGAKL